MGGTYEVKVETLLSLHDESFELWKEEKHKSTFYHLGIEGYLGFEKLEDAIDLYNEFLQELEMYLLENNYVKPEKYDWNTVYKKRGMKVCYEHDCYWIFLEPYKTTEIWDTYNYLKDVIDQLKEIKQN